MSETPEKMVDILQSSALIQYLDRRQTQPVGVVNVRQLQPRFLRVSSAIAQRFALLERLKNRYGSAEEQAVSDADLTLATLAQPLSENTSNSLSEIAQSIAAVNKPATPTSETSSNPTETFRVSRRILPPLASFSPLGKTGEKGDKGDKGETRENKSSSETRLVFLGNEAMPSESFPSLPLKNLGKIEQDDVTKNDISVQTTSATSRVKRELEGKHPTTSPLPIAKPIITQIQPSSESIPLPLDKSTPLIQRPIEQASITEEHSILKHYSQSKQQPLIKTSPYQSPLRDMNPLGEQSAIASEIPLHQSALSQSPMVWRNNDTNGSKMTVNGNAIATASRRDIASSPFATNPMNQNSQFATNQPIQAGNNYATPIAASATQNSNYHTVAATNSQSSKPEPNINVAQIAEQVSRILSRQLTVERERRGISR